MKALLGWRDHPGQSSLPLVSQYPQKPRKVVVVPILEEWRAQYANQTQPTERCITTEAQVRDITKKLLSLLQPMDYYPQLVFWVSSDEVPTERLWTIKTELMALGQLVKGSRAQAMFSSVLPLALNDGARNRIIMQMNGG